MIARCFLIVSLAASLAGCEKRSRVEDADERRLSELRELEKRATDREAAANAAAIDKDRAALANERERLERDRAQLDEEQQRASDRHLAQIREQQEANQKRAEQQRLIDGKLQQERAADERNAQRQAQGEQTLDFFYKALDPYGDWAYTNYGWTWVSQEPFGWATYHYGRWTRVRSLGWVWVPGSEWAPAWVAWRQSDRDIGWAPLPPEAHSGAGFNAAVDSYYDIGPGQYNFVSIQDFGEPTYVGRVLEPEQNVTVLNQTTNVTNITYRTVENRTVVYNGGPQFSEMNSHTAVRRMEVERVSQAPNSSQPGGNVLRLLAPFIASAAKPAGEPAKVRQRIKAPEVERGWSGSPAKAAAEVRERQKQEAHRAEEAQRVPAAAAPRPAKIEPAKPRPEARPEPAPGPKATLPPPRAPVNPPVEQLANPRAEQPRPHRGTPPPVVTAPEKPAPASPQTEKPIPEEKAPPALTLPPSTPSAPKLPPAEVPEPAATVPPPAPAPAPAAKPRRADPIRPPAPASEAAPAAPAPAAAAPAQDLVAEKPAMPGKQKPAGTRLGRPSATPSATPVPPTPAG